MYGPYKDIKFTDFSGGLATRVEDNLIKDNQSPDLLNVIFDGKGSVIPRMGSKLFGTSSSIMGKIKDTWKTYDINGRETMIRTVNTSASAWIEYYNNQTAAWETLDAGYTKDQNFGHCNYDYFTYYSNPVDYQRRWTGVSWATSTYADSAYHRIDLSTSAASALGFLSAGSVVIGGEEVYYANVTGTALSGITFADAHSGGVAIAQLPTSAGENPVSAFPYYDLPWTSASSALPHGNIMINKDSQFFVAGISGTEQNRVYYSVVDDVTNYTVSAAPAYGGYEPYTEGGVGIKSLADFQEVIAVMKEDTVRQLKFTQISDGNSGITEIVDKNGLATSPYTGAVNHKSLAQIENQCVFTSPNGWVRTIASTADGRKLNEISTDIRPTVEDLNMVSAAATYFAGKYYLACATADATVNDVVYVYDTEYKAWTRFNGWNVADWVVYNNRLYFGASNEIATYQALVDYNDNTQAYDSYWSSKWLDFGLPDEQKMLRQIYVEGYMTTNKALGVSCYFDGDVAAPVKKSISGTGSYVSTTDNINVIGETTWGKGEFGGLTRGSSYNLKKFRVNLQYPNKPFYNLQIKIGSSNANYVWKITHIAPYLRAIPGKRIPTNQLI